MNTTINEKSEVSIDDHFNLATHNGIITVENTNRGTHRTFRIKTQKDDDSFAPGERILSLLTGPDNTNDYMQIGFVKTNKSGRAYVILWRRHRNDTMQALVKVLLNTDHYRKLGVRYHHEGRCIKCNRCLTTPESVRNGIGPKCASSIKERD